MADDTEVWRVLSPEELKEGAGGDAGAPKSCQFGDKIYASGTARRGSKGIQYRCTDGVWVEESLIDPTDPWAP